MGRKHDEIWQELCELDNRVTRLEDRAILKPEYDPADVAFNRAKPWQWQEPTARPAAPVDGLAQLRAENARLVAERDALRARIEAGRVMYGGMYGHQNKFEMWTFEHVYTDTMTARLIDIAPIADAGEMADERRGERRVAKLTAAIHSNVRMNDRRRTPGTRADRKAGSNE